MQRTLNFIFDFIQFFINFFWLIFSYAIKDIHFIFKSFSWLFFSMMRVRFQFKVVLDFYVFHILIKIIIRVVDNMRRFYQSRTFFIPIDL